METLIEKKKRKKKIIARAIAMMLILCTMIAAFTGCGFAGAKKMNGDYGKTTDVESGTSLLVVEWDDMITTCKPDGSPSGEKQSGLWMVALEAKTPYGIDSRNGITFLRDIAVMMYDSLFGKDRRADDQFCKDNNDGAWGGLKLDPIAVVSSINDQTIATIKKNEGAFSDIMEGAQTLASGVLIAIWSIGFISQIVNEKFTMETFLKTTMQLLCGIVIVKNSDKIIWAFLEAGQALISDAAGSEVVRFEKLAEQMDGWLDTGIISINFGIDLMGLICWGLGSVWLDLMPLVVILFLALPFYALLRCIYQIASQLIMRIFELTVRVTLAPIPLAFSAQNGFSHETIRYFRGVLACALQPMLIIVGTRSLVIVDELVKGALSVGQSSVIVNMLSMTLVYFILGAYIGETKHLAKEIIAH